jgi:uncharacterized membrane protein YdjX (TVP38/TMEM64 family)
MKRWLRFLPILLIVCGMLALYLSGVTHQVTLYNLEKEVKTLQTLVSQHPVASNLAYFGIYILSVFLVVPDSTILGLAGGFLFPLPLAVFYIIASETLGAFLFYASTRLAFARWIAKKKYPRLVKIQKNLQENQTSYLLFARFSHLIPFWLINLAAGTFNARIWPFIWTTFLGVLPLAFVLAEAGKRLGYIFATHERITLANILTPKVKLALFALALLALVPLLIKWLRKNNTNRGK